MSKSLSTGDSRSLEQTAVAVDTELTCLARTALEVSLKPNFEVQLTVEIQHVQSMGVIINPGEYSGSLGKELRAKMVRT